MILRPVTQSSLRRALPIDVHHVRKRASSDRVAETAVSASVTSALPPDTAELLFFVAAATGSPLMMYWFVSADDGNAVSANAAAPVIASNLFIGFVPFISWAFNRLLPF